MCLALSLALHSLLSLVPSLHFFFRSSTRFLSQSLHQSLIFHSFIFLAEHMHLFASSYLVSIPSCLVKMSDALSSSQVFEGTLYLQEFYFFWPSSLLHTVHILSISFFTSYLIFFSLFLSLIKIFISFFN